ncbi:hypothetical protein HYPSUDRAFT_38074 [Hypholoma sublateritium FD-334 SS-4]|uniref:Uncharacterized protein n=1 Tax=Hypholoma sublateritium (strain FD-334 SS-4) TaxID=945553 RepID=A0A0D2MMF0_HYPSF|nr:hypothetical protein HYPSUDRAFT_38074 [Hypholoma sublateritium FD-334 SS-4]
MSDITVALEYCNKGDIASLTGVLSDPSINITDNLLFDLLQTSSGNGNAVIVHYLLNLYNPKTLDDKVYRAAAVSNSIDTFKLIFARNPMCITEFFERRGTLLAIALASGASPEFIEYLLSIGADPSVSSDDTISPLAYAAHQYDSPAMVKLLTEHGAQLKGSGVLASAAKKGAVATVKYLLDQKADPNDPGSWPQPTLALHTAVKGGYLDICKLLLVNGADARLKDGSGKTAIDIARDTNNKEIISLLEL